MQTQRRPRWWGGMLALLVVLLGAGCGSQQGAPGAGGGEARDLTLRFATPSFGLERMDPSQGFTGAITAGPMLDWLIEYTPEGKLAPSLAQRWEQAPDLLSWTIQLKKGAKFHDGTEMTAEDAAFSLKDAFRRPESTSASVSKFRRAIKDVVVVDPATVRVVLTEPWITFPYSLSSYGGIEGVVLPKQYITRVGWQGFEEKPMGTGPWKFVEHKRGNSLEFERFGDYWQGAPKFARLKVLLIPEQSTRLAMIQTGEADVADIAPDRISEVEKSGKKVLEFPLFSTVRVNLWGTYYPEAGPVGNVKVREALNLAVNRDEMIKALFNGRGQPAPVTMSPHTIGFPQDLKPYPYDPARAKQLLAEAGYPNGFDIKFYSYGAGPFTQFKEVGEAMAGYWGAIGVKTSIIPTDLTTMRPRYFGDKPQDPSIVGNAGVIGLPTGLDGVIELNTWWTVKGANMKLAPNVDDLAAQAESARTIEEMTDKVKQAFGVLHRDYRNVPIAHVKGIVWAYGNQLGSVRVIPTLSQALAATLWTATPAR